MTRTYLLLAVLATGPALAQDRPALMPTRDVTITYRTAGQGNQPGPEIRMSWLAGRGMLRVDMGQGQGWLVTDARAGGGFLVMDAQRIVMDLPPGAGPARGALPRPSARYTREGSSTIAGLACTIWRVEEAGETARTCLTADGIMLSAATAGGREGEGNLTAVSVTPGPQDPARFQRPEGFRSVQMPGGLPQSTVPQGGGATLPRGTALPPPGIAPPTR